MRLLPTPRYTSIDPTPYVGIFFPLFFGMILGDAGYGLLLLLAAAGVSWKWYSGGRTPTGIDAHRYCSICDPLVHSSAVMGSDLRRNLQGLDAFSHLVVVYHFHLADPSKVVTAARHPRGNEQWPKVGIFAQRGKDRPNRVGDGTLTGGQQSIDRWFDTTAFVPNAASVTVIGRTQWMSLPWREKNSCGRTEITR